MGFELQNEEGVKEPSSPLVNEISEMKERLVRIDSFIKQALALAAIESRRGDEIKRNFEAAVASLEDRLRGTEEALTAKGPDLKEAEESLTARIQELESRLEEKERLLEARDAEPAALEPEDAENRVAVLEAQLQEKESALKEMENSLAELEEGLLSQIHDLEKRFQAIGQKRVRQGKRKRGAPGGLSSSPEGSPTSE